jgi:two-component system, OmpR family, lantibiotic biosynthesis response regulator NisR/SpaR
MNYKILVIDDEKDVVSLLKDFFELQGYTVYTACDGFEALQKVEVNPDIILLDINMPQMDGIEVCKRIRNYISCPILFLTAKVEEEDRINGLLVGGDDYILKPFSIDELEARVIAHLRREERKINKEKIRFAKDLVISYSERNVSYQGTVIALTKTEFDIVEILSLNKGQTFTKERIYEKLWGFDKDGDSNIITEHIRRIRSKLGRYCKDSVIDTVWGVGYRWIG